MRDSSDSSEGPPAARGIHRIHRRGHLPLEGFARSAFRHQLEIQAAAGSLARRRKGGRVVESRCAPVLAVHPHRGRSHHRGVVTPQGGDFTIWRRCHHRFLVSSPQLSTSKRGGYTAWGGYIIGGGGGRLHHRGGYIIGVGVPLRPPRLRSRARLRARRRALSGGYTAGPCASGDALPDDVRELVGGVWREGEKCGRGLARDQEGQEALGEVQPVGDADQDLRVG